MCDLKAYLLIGPVCSEYLSCFIFAQATQLVTLKQRATLMT